MPNDRRRHPRPASAVPTEIPDDEALTPPPIDVEEIRRLADTVPPSLGEQVVTMASWIDKLSGERVGASRLNRIDDKLASIADSVSRHDAVLNETLKPQLDYWRATTDALAAQVPRLAASIESMTLLVGDINRRLHVVELAHATLAAQVGSDSRDVKAAIELAVKERAEMRREIDALKESALVKATASTAIAKRDKWWIAAITAVVGFAAGSLPTVIRFLSNHF